MNYVIQAKLMDGTNWLMGIYPGPKNILMLKWSPYYEDSKKYNIEDAQKIFDAYILNDPGMQADIVHISDADRRSSATIFEKDGYCYMGRTVRARILEKGDTFIHFGTWYTVADIENGRIMAKKPDGTNIIDVCSSSSEEFVYKVYLSTKTLAS